MPGLRGEVPRYVNIRLRHLDREGAEHEEIKRGLTAGTFQHELDHLDGTLFVDRVTDPSDVRPPGISSSASTETLSSSARGALVERVGS